MKRGTILLLILSVFTLFTFAGNTVTISGTVTDLETGEPAANQMVFIYTDSLNGSGYYNMVFTNDIGEYADSFETPPSQSGGLLIVSVLNCYGEPITQYLQFDPNNYNLTADFEICIRPSIGDCYADFWYFQMEELTVEFQDWSQPNPSTWAWDFGDGNTSEEQNPVHQYTEAGTYQVTLSIFVEETGCESTVTWEVWVDDFNYECMAWFFSYPLWEEPLAVQFEDFSFFEPGTYYWEFGDGETSDEQNPMHIYAEEGEYEVSLTITSDDASCEDTYTEIIYVEEFDPECSADFWYYQISDLSVQFEDFSRPDPETWAWDFGDGNTSQEQSPLHTYEQAGVYQVCLTITNQNANCEDTRCFDVFVDTMGFVDCYADFWYFQMEELTVEFQDWSWPNPSTWAWDFGDGNTSEEQNPVHQYAEAGTYQVTLSIFVEETECESTVTWEVWVDDFNYECQALYFWMPNQEEPLTIDFTDISFYQGDVEFYWEFGDGATSAEENPSHIYSEEGEYEVCLTISRPDSSCYSTFCEIIYVGEINPYECESDFEAIHLEDLTYQFEGYFRYGMGNGDFSWDFGDGTTGFGSSVEHTFAEEGEYTVCLTTVIYSPAADSCYWTTCHTIVVGSGNQPLQASFTMAQDSVNPLLIHFFDTSTGNPQEWLWDFGDGQVSTEQNPSHEYADASSYDVCLTIFGQGNSDTYCEQIETSVTFASINENNGGISTGEIYPNPNNGNFFIDVIIANESTVDIQLINYVGQMVYKNTHSVSNSGTKIGISTSGLPTGIYSLILNSNNQKIAKKIIIE